MLFPPHLLPSLSNIIPLGKPPPLHEIFSLFLTTFLLRATEIPGD